MKKPTKHIVKQPMFEYDDVINYIEGKYGIKVRDYAGKYGNKGKESHFDEYQKLMKDPMPFGNGKYPDCPGTTYRVYKDGKLVEGTKDEYDAQFKLIHAQYARYQEWCKTNPEPPYLDYWHWLLDEHFYDMQNGCERQINVKEILEDDKSPSWVKEITQLIHTEFESDLDDEGCLTVWIEW